MVLHHQFEVYHISALWAKDCQDEQNTGDFIAPFFSCSRSFKHFTAGPFGDW